MEIKRKQIWMAKLLSEGGSVQAGIRPVLVIQNDKGNKYAPTVIVVPLTKQMKKLTIPTHVIVPSNTQTGLRLDSVAQMEQVRTIPKNILVEHVGECDETTINKINIALAISQGLIPEFNSQLVDAFTLKIKKVQKAIDTGSLEEMLEIRDYFIKQLKNYCKKHNKGNLCKVS